MKGLIFSVVFLLQAAKPAPVPGLPAPDGVYYLQGDGKWFKLDKPVAAKSKTKGMGLFIETDGLANVNMTTVYYGAEASLEISTPRPTLYVRGAGSPQDAVIVQLLRKKDSRVLQTSKEAATVENKGGFKKAEIHKVTATAYSDDSFSVTPDNDLKPGEYLLVFSNSGSAFEFGVTAAKK